MKTEKELKEEIEKLIDDDNTIEDYSETLKEIEETFKSKGDDIQTGMFILIKVAKLKTLQERNTEVKQAIKKLEYEWVFEDQRNNLVKHILSDLKELLQKLGLDRK